MKNVSLLVVAMLFASAPAWCQTSDKTRSPHEKTNRSGEDLKPSDSKPLNGNEYGEWTHFPKDQVTQQMKQTLKGSKYKGWEKMGIYQNKDRTKYYIQTGKGNNTKRYEFDNSFKPINSGTDAGGDYPATSPSKNP